MNTTSEIGSIAFVCAMPIELVPLTKKLALTETEVGGVAMQTGMVAERAAVAIVTGMGTKFAREGMERLLDAVAVDWVVVVGITGALENETPIGTLVMPEIVVHSATGAEHRPHRLADEEPHGKMWTTDGLTTNPDMLTDLRARGIVSLDMETAAIADVCDGRGIPWSVFRTISDRASDGSVDEEVFRLSNQDGTPNHEAIAAYAEKYPERLSLLAKMGEDCVLATNAAADAAIRAVAMHAATT